MRITLDLDDDLARAVQQRATEQAISFGEALRRLLQRAVVVDRPRTAEAPLFYVIQDLMKVAGRERSHQRS